MPRLASFSRKTSSAAATRSSVSACRVTASSPAQATVALTPRKSKRWESSLPAWFSALSTSWPSTLLTTSKDASAMTVSSLRAARTRRGPSRRSSAVLYAHRAPERGGLPEWPMGADCKSVGLAYEGSNPSPATPGATAPDLTIGGRRRSPGRGGAGAGHGGAFQRLPTEEQPVEGDPHRPRAPHRHLRTIGLRGPGVQLHTRVGQLVGDRRLRGGPAERQLRTDADGVHHRLVGLVGRRQRRAVADRLDPLLLQERVGRGDRPEDHQRGHQPADQHERQRGPRLGVQGAPHPRSVEGGRPSATGCGRELWTMWTTADGRPTAAPWPVDDAHGRRCRPPDSPTWRSRWCPRSCTRSQGCWTRPPARWPRSAAPWRGRCPVARSPRPWPASARPPGPQVAVWPVS